VLLSFPNAQLRVATMLSFLIYTCQAGVANVLL